MREAALSWLGRDPLLHVCMTECIRRGRAEILYSGNDGVLLRDPEGKFLAASFESPDALRPRMPMLHQKGFDLLLHQQFALEMAGAQLPELTFCMHCYHSVYTKKEPLHAALPEGMHMERLTLRHAGQVAEVYTHASADYVTECIRAGLMLGAFCGGELAGFIGQHVEGAQGLLEVLPAYRRRGLASALMAASINAALDRGETPFGQIITDNEASLALSRSLGLEISAGVAHWLFC